MKRIKFRRLKALMAFLFLSVVTVSAIDVWNTGYRVDTGTKDVLVDENEECHKVINTSSNSYFVPTKRTTEWLSFSTNLPSGVSVESCGPVEIAISTCEELQKIGNDAEYLLDGKYVLTQNIDCSATSGWNSGAGFDSIGDSSNKFTGIFDGKGYEINDLYINRSTEDYIGLFGYTNEAKIENIGVVNVNISGDDYIGGLVGYNTSSRITNSYSTGSVDGDDRVGGLVGQNSYSTITNSYSTGSVVGSGYHTGGLVGYNTSSSVTNSYSTGSVVSSGYYTGGLVGYNYVSSTITNSYSIGSVVGSYYTGGLVGENYSFSTITNSYWNIDTSGQVISDGGIGKTTVQMKLESTYTGWDFQLPETDTWKLNEITPSGNYYPCLSWQDNSTCIVAPVVISTCEDLQKIGNDAEYPLDGKYILTQNIDCSATSGWNSGAGFDPIGDSSNKFTGIFDGKGYEINNLYINRSTEDYIGLFGYTNRAEIKNIGMVNVNLSGDDYIGGLVGHAYSYSTITNSYSTGSMDGDYYMGGLVGRSYSSTITDSYSTGSVSSSGSYVGGLVGYNYYSSTITDSYSTGSVDGDDNTGGLVGRNYSSTITNSYSTGSVVGSGSYTGGLVGYNNYYPSTITNSYSTGSVSGDDYTGGLVGYNYNSSTITNSYSTGSVVGSGSYIGGLVGYNYNYSTITNSYSTGSVVSSGSYTGGLVGRNVSSTITNSYWDIEISGQASSAGGVGKTTAQMKLESTYTGWDFQLPETDTWKLNEITLAGSYYPCLSWQDNGTCPIVSIPISTCEDLQKIGNDAEYPLDENYVLTQNIDCSATSGWNSGAGFDPIGDSSDRFKGIFDGKGYEINNLYINRSTADHIGLFSYISWAEIKNIGVVNVNISGDDYIGGLVGYTYEATITNSYSTGSVSGDDYTGGLVGYLSYNSTIINSYSTGSVNGKDDYTGGLVGQTYGATITNSYSTSSVDGDDNTGGLVGKNSNVSTITNSYSTGSVSGDDYTGGFVGYNYYYSTVTNSYSTGSVSSDYYTGGLVGYNYYSSTIINSYSTGSVSGGDYTGGLVGRNASSTITDSYWNTELSGQVTSAGGVGKITAQMKLESTYTNWDFQPSETDTWKLNEITPVGSYYPCLSWQENSTCPIASVAISTCENLQKIGNDAEYPLDGKYILTQNIDCSATTGWNSGQGFDPIGDHTNNFTGTFDGKNYKISNLYINRNNKYYVGLFGYALGSGELKNVELVNVDITA
ncbi:hypothetical protein KAI58_04400, partial [Candidatus Gracilibacteria bacterium]|nr:hypothetical protein [Candidatus Gracilibacteria bacterium]